MRRTRSQAGGDERRKGKKKKSGEGDSSRSRQFRSLREEAKFYALANRTLIHGKSIDLEAFEGLGIVSLFSNLNLLPILTHQHTSHPTAVKLFYAHLEADKRHGNSVCHTLASFVNGQEVLINDEILGTVLGIPAAGYYYYAPTWPVSDEIVYLDAMRTLTENQDLTEDDIWPLGPKLTVPLMPVRYKFLHHIIYHTIFHRAGHKEEVSFMDTLLMYLLVRGTPVNLPALIIDHIAACAENPRGNKSLPCEMFISMALAHLGIEFDPQDSVHFNPSSHLITKAKLEQKGYKRIRRNDAYEWVPHRRGRGRQQQEVEESGDEEEEIRGMEQGGMEQGGAEHRDDPTPPQQAPGVSSTPAATLVPYDGSRIPQHWYTSMARLTDQMQQLTSRVDTVETHVRRTEETVHSMNATITRI